MTTTTDTITLTDDELRLLRECQRAAVASHDRALAGPAAEHYPAIRAATQADRDALAEIDLTDGAGLDCDDVVDLTAAARPELPDRLAEIDALDRRVLGSLPPVAPESPAAGDDRPTVICCRVIFDASDPTDPAWIVRYRLRDPDGTEHDLDESARLVDFDVAHPDASDDDLLGLADALAPSWACWADFGVEAEIVRGDA